MVKCNGYIFKKHTTLENGTTHLRCFLNNYRKCKARAVVHPTNPMLIRPNSAVHSHPREDYMQYKQIREFFLKPMPDCDPNLLVSSNAVQNVNKKSNKRDSVPGPSELSTREYSDDLFSALLDHDTMIPNIEIKQESFN